VIPCLATVRVGGRRRRGIRLWLPLFLLWPLILPLAGAPRTAWQLASGLRGMHIEVDSPEVAFQVRFI